MAHNEKETSDNKAIEEKALNYFKSFIEDSKVISQYLYDNDKEPCWDGHLYLYADGKRDKDHLLGRVPVQIKGTEVNKIDIKLKFKYKLDKVDLKAYLHEPTFFIVCQVERNSKGRKLFFRELLPDSVNKLLRYIGEQQSKKTLFHSLTDDLNEFEEQLKIFMGNSKKMISFAESKPLTMSDAMKKGIKEFSFIAPDKFVNNRIELMRYLTTHKTYLYAQLSKELNVEMPISDGPVQFAFKGHNNGDVKVGNKTYFRGFDSEMKDGHIIVQISNVLTIDWPMEQKGSVCPNIQFISKATNLKAAINELEFALSLHDIGDLKLGDACFKMTSSEKDNLDDIRRKYAKLVELDSVLDKLHVNKQIDLSTITREQGRLIDILIDTVGKGNSVRIPEQDSRLITMDIGNIKLLLWCNVNEDGECEIGDYFDKTLRITYTIKGDKNIHVSPFSYLQNEDLWEKIDNIDYDSIIDSAQEAADDNTFCYQMSNLDVLAMIKASDHLENTDSIRSGRLLSEALKLDEWLISADPTDEMKVVHVINKYQIIKRQREFTNDDKSSLKELLNHKGLSEQLKFAVLLLLEKKLDAMKIYATLPEMEKNRMREFPIWRFCGSEE